MEMSHIQSDLYHSIPYFSKKKFTFLTRLDSKSIILFYLVSVPLLTSKVM